MAKDKIIVRFNEDSLDIVLMKYEFGKSILNKHKTLITRTGSNNIYDSESVVYESKEFIRRYRVRNKTAVAILSLDSVITRLVETPYMSKKELQSFIKNNINEYFTVNIQDYYYDYRILETSQDEVKKFSVLLAVIPKSKLEDIYGYLQNIGVNIGKITIYPECLANLMRKKKGSIAIVDCVKDISNITILKDNKLFLHSSSHIEGDFKDNYDEILDNMAYFLNFYSTRHFGNRVDKIYLLGKLACDDDAVDYLKNQIDIPIEVGIETISQKALSRKKEDLHVFTDIYGWDFKVIDFNKPLKASKVDEKAQNNRQYLALSSILIILSVLWVSVSSYLINKKTLSYNVNNINISKRIQSLEEVEQQYTLLMEQRDLYEKDKKSLEKIKADGIDYMYYLEKFRQGLPSNVLVNSVYIEKGKIELKMDINNNTMDRVNLYIAINNMKLFKKLEIEDIKLDDTEKEDNLILEILNPR